MKLLVKRAAERKLLEGKNSTFRVRGQAVEPEKVDRFMKRKGLTDEQIISAQSPAMCK